MAEKAQVGPINRRNESRATPLGQRRVAPNFPQFQMLFPAVARRLSGQRGVLAVGIGKSSRSCCLWMGI